MALGSGDESGESCPGADSWETSGTDFSTLKCHVLMAIQDQYQQKVLSRPECPPALASPRARVVV